jgi:hypothetical protein
VIGRLAAALFVVPLAVVACGSTPLAGTPAANVITGGASCPADEKQDLSFTGAITGHISCSIGQASCTKNAANTRSAVGLDLPINARIGSTAVQFVFGWFNDKVGTYPAGKTGEEGTSSQGATLDGFGHWITPDGAGTMVLAIDDAMGASGSLDIKLVSGAQSFGVKGTWRCLKPAGF